MKDVQIRKLIFAHDLSKFANSSLPYVAAIAKKWDAKVILLCVVNSIGQELAFYATPGMYPSTLGNAAIDIVEENKKHALKKLEKIGKLLEEKGLKFQVKVEEGYPQEVLVDVAKKEKCDLIVMATHGRSGVSRAFLGSVADYVIRNASCPVLTVNPKI